MTVPLAATLADAVHATAISLARQHKLESGGVIYCWNCSQRPALMPSLHCPPCLAEAWRRNGARMLCQNREQTPADAEACRG